MVINFNLSIVNLMQRYLLTVNLSPMKQRGTNFADLCRGYLFLLKIMETAVSVYTKNQ